MQPRASSCRAPGLDTDREPDDRSIRTARWTAPRIQVGRADRPDHRAHFLPQGAGSALAASGHYIANQTLSEEVYAVTTIPSVSAWLIADAIETVGYLIQNHSKQDLKDLGKTLLEGVAEKAILKTKVGQHLQFERFGYVVVDKIEKDKVTLWFSHQ